MYLLCLPRHLFISILKKKKKKSLHRIYTLLIKYIYIYTDQILLSISWDIPQNALLDSFLAIFSEITQF